MSTQQALIGFVAIAVPLGALIGCWILHRRIRSWVSLSLLLSVAGFLTWEPVSEIADSYFASLPDAAQSKPAVNYLAVAIDEFVPSSLLLVAFASWVLVVRFVGSPARTSVSIGLFFGTLFLISVSYMSWFIGLHFAWSYLPGLEMPLLAATVVACVTSVAFWLGTRRNTSTHSPAAVVTYATVLFFLLCSSNKFFLPGIVAPLVLVSLGALLLGSRGFVSPVKVASG